MKISDKRANSRSFGEAVFMINIPEHKLQAWVDTLKQADNLITRQHKRLKNCASRETDLVCPRRQTALRLAIHDMERMR